MTKDLKQEFLQLRINKAREEMKKLLEKNNLLLSAELNFTTGGIFPIIKLVERNQMSDEPQATEAVETSPEVQEEVVAEEATPEVAEVPAEEVAA